MIDCFTLDWRQVAAAVTAFPPGYKYPQSQCGELTHHEETRASLACRLPALSGGESVQQTPSSPVQSDQHHPPALQVPQGLQPLQHRPVSQQRLHLHQLDLQQWDLSHHLRVLLQGRFSPGQLCCWLRCLLYL